MPELPEVEVVRRGIEPALVGRRLAGADFRRPDLRYPLPRAEAAGLIGRRLVAVRRRGKYLLFDFGSDIAPASGPKLRPGGGHLLIHLGMSGSLRLVPRSQPPGKHDHVDLIFGATALRMRDPRRFGAMLWLEGDPLAHPLLSVLGIEPLSGEFTARWLKSAFAGLKTAIKPALMDGRRVVGIGNIYASESLFRAGIDPRTAAGRVSPVRLERLVPAIKATLTAAIKAGGSSLRDFIHSDGGSGCFQQQYFVYGREGESCRVCGGAIRALRQAQRASFFCPRCQR